VWHPLCCMQMLFTGGFDVLCYELGPGKVMVTMQRGWNAVGVKDFLLEQPEVCCVCGARLGVLVSVTMCMPIPMHVPLFCWSVVGGLRLCALVCVFMPRSMPMRMPHLVGVRVRARGS
jgi:hypothetical protein